MRILVISDTHGHENSLKKLLDKVRPIDYLIHCGDAEEHEDLIRRLAACPCSRIPFYLEIFFLYNVFPFPIISL